MSGREAGSHLDHDWYRLRPVEPEDYRLLRHVDTGRLQSARWRMRGATPSPEEWLSTLWNNVLAQFVVVRKRDAESIALVGLYGVNLQDGHGKLFVIRFDVDVIEPVLMVAVVGFIEYCFGCWPLRKLYLEVDEFNFSSFRSGEGTWFDIEGRLIKHSYFDGRYWDHLICSIDRDRWRARIDERSAT